MDIATNELLLNLIKSKKKNLKINKIAFNEKTFGA